MDDVKDGSKVNPNVNPTLTYLLAQVETSPSIQITRLNRERPKKANVEKLVVFGAGDRNVNGVYVRIEKMKDGKAQVRRVRFHAVCSYTQQLHYQYPTHAHPMPSMTLKASTGWLVGFIITRRRRAGVSSTAARVYHRSIHINHH